MINRLAGSMLLLSMLVGCASERAVYVSSAGNDRWPGTRTKPVKSLEIARTIAHKNKATNVWLRGGTYLRTSTFELDRRDNGIAYQAYPGEKVILRGGREVHDFAAVTNEAILKRLDPSARTNVLVANLKANGITDFGEIDDVSFGRPVIPLGLDVFAAGKPMQLARWPNTGWANIASVPNGPQGHQFTYSGDRATRWTGAKDVWIHGFLFYPWADGYEKITNIDTNRHLFELKDAPNPGQEYGLRAGGRYYAFNLLEELDQPGEWYLDRENGNLYLWPTAPIKEGDIVVSELTNNFVHIKDATNVTLRGVTMECSRFNGVLIEGGCSNVVAGCTMRNLGGLGVEVRSGTHNGVKSCNIYQCGQGAITLTGGDRKTLTPAGNFAINNDVWDYQRWSWAYHPGVNISGVGNIIAHNHFHDIPHQAILLRGNDHVIEFNEMDHMCNETDDAGAFYLGRNPTERGNIARYNYIHDMGGHDAQGVYLDDCACGTTVYGNVIVHCTRGVLLGGGRDILIENNVFVDCPVAVHVDARGMNWMNEYFNGKNNQFSNQLAEVNYKNPPYSEKYPGLANYMEDEPATPKRNRVVKNISTCSRWMDLLAVQEKPWGNDFSGNLSHDVKFADAPHHDYNPAADSPAWKLGFKRIPIEQIGLQLDDDRQRLP